MYLWGIAIQPTAGRKAASDGGSARAKALWVPGSWDGRGRVESGGERQAGAWGGRDETKDRKAFRVCVEGE